MIFLQKITEPTAFSAKRRQAAKKKGLKVVGSDKGAELLYFSGALQPQSGQKFVVQSFPQVHFQGFTGAFAPQSGQNLVSFVLPQEQFHTLPVHEGGVRFSAAIRNRSSARVIY